MKNSLQLKDEKRSLKDEAFAILETCKAEIRDLTEEENQKLSDIKTKINNINE